jgi:predicted P-loop ATPase
VFWGSTNGDNYLTDETGGRRFLPIITTKIDIIGLEDYADQIFAEAVQKYHEHVPWWITEPEAEAEAKVEQRARLKEDPWTRSVAGFIDSVTDPDRITMKNIIDALRIPIERQTTGDAKRVAGILHSLGWVRRQVRLPGKGDRREWRYKKDPTFE